MQRYEYISLSGIPKISDCRDALAHMLTRHADQAASTWKRVGVAYELENGDIIYVPEN